MEFFKQRARQILVEPLLGMHYNLEEEYLYEGNALPLKLCYQQLKNLIKRPAPNIGQSLEKPNYMKMTFAMSRSVAPNSKILQLSSMVGNIKNVKKDDSVFGLKAIGPGGKSSNSDLTLLKQIKNNGSDFSIKPPALLSGKQPDRKKTKREEMIDTKIEKLLITYKQRDEQAKRRAGNLDAEKALGKKNLLDKFGFSDDEESVIENF